MQTIEIPSNSEQMTCDNAQASCNPEVNEAVRAEMVCLTDPTAPGGTGRVDWSKCEAVTRDRSGERVLSAEESANLIAEAGGKW